MISLGNWNTIAESSFSWERDALDFVRQQFPAHEPYRAWSNFEFIATDGSINEVDLLVFTPQGFFLIEIKSRPGSLVGDAGTWTWKTNGKLFTTDNPLIAANTKAKKLRALLERQKACRSKGQLPFLEALVFYSAPDLRCELQGTARDRVTPARLGIMAAILRRECSGVDPQPRGNYDRPTAKTISQAMEQAGIRPLQRHRKVSDYVLDQMIGEGPGYQDWEATHAQLSKAKRRVRLYLVRLEAAEEDRKLIERAALRVSPHSILVTQLEHDRPQIEIFNWQVGYRVGSTSGASREVTAVSRVDRLVEDASTAYLAPEALTDEGVVGSTIIYNSLAPSVPTTSMCKSSLADVMILACCLCLLA